jgi:hypothetical protein
LQSASVILSPLDDTTNTGFDGEYLFNCIAPGNYMIKALKQNYAEITKSAIVSSANTSVINFALDGMPVMY